jgi:hypothetical protein
VRRARIAGNVLPGIDLGQAPWVRGQAAKAARELKSAIKYAGRGWRRWPRSAPVCPFGRFGDLLETQPILLSH